MRDVERAGAAPAPGGPLLFLDVDGPLIPFGATPQQLPGGYPTFPSGSSGAPDPAANPLLTRLDPALGPLLAALPCELVWATTWMDEANDSVAPRLGLPHLPVLDDLPVPDDPEQEPTAVGLGRRAPHWKVPAMVAWAAGRAFVWVDDEVSGTDRAWVAAHHPGRALLHPVDARLGLTARDFTVLDDWLRAAQ
ncbi:hypothetical protein DSC45_15055 [Streptomyces sp. YIM 130001]|uniref:HAD domain-containing protein n=1 Tax=Streptomyces sp. YIM 130001 TaxID=2259644 RepID=UPI000E6534A1|nr:HAD domain-containing protein [Streptomyces sp. YIM 130001]RII17079.1 hypothetical protein DSC45_15055 [Streptomyces sp. YIM 130001]